MSFYKSDDSVWCPKRNLFLYCVVTSSTKSIVLREVVGLFCIVSDYIDYGKVGSIRLYYSVS